MDEGRRGRKERDFPPLPTRVPIIITFAFPPPPFSQFQFVEYRNLL